MERTRLLFAARNWCRVFHAPYANFAKLPEVEAFAKGGSGRVQR